MFWAIWAGFAILTAVIASAKNKGTGKWLLLGILFGIFALVYVAFAERGPPRTEVDQQPAKGGFGKWVLFIFGVLAVFYWIGSGVDQGPGGPGPASTSRAECNKKGVAYFREIGAFPKLSDGRDARTVVSERCSRTTGAFNRLR